MAKKTLIALALAAASLLAILVGSYPSDALEAKCVICGTRCEWVSRDGAASCENKTGIGCTTSGTCTLRFIINK